MESEYLDKLREMAFFLRIVPKARQDHAVAVDVLIKMLSSLQESYARYAEVIFRHDFTSQTKEVKKMENDQFPLLIVDLKYESFGAALAPDYITASKYDVLMRGEGLSWKKETFQNFKEDVLYSDLASTTSRNRIKSKFTEDERRAIYSPIFRSIHSSPNYSVIVKPSSNGIEHLLRDLPVTIISEITPSREKVKSEEPKTKFMRAYFEVDESSDQIFSKKSIRKVIAFTNVPMDELPYFPERISLPGEMTIILNEKIEVTVQVDEEGLQFIYEPLEIAVWGETREDAEEAFNFTFISLYESYALEEDVNLTEGAKQLKDMLMSLVHRVEEGGTR
ncbi:hypothetical protein [uncultured Pontibacter sp.]|uniref:hypothetical protein n=1 Tax=uncultured Pontibacter sp. TaxID=453356 RepID=UPI002619C140|nr:hypothetical protein [uncultured Pontibacter sp.]